MYSVLHINIIVSGVDEMSLINALVSYWITLEEKKLFEIN